MMYSVVNSVTKRWFSLAIVLLFSFPAISQTKFQVTYNGDPACNTVFTVTDTSERVVYGSGTSDENGVFSCNCNIDDNAPALLKADPVEKGAKWTLMLPTMGTINGISVDYEVKIEEIEATIREAMDAQNEMLGESKKQNSSMNSGGETTGESEIAMIGGLVKTGHTLIDSQFKLIKNSMSKSCGGNGLGVSIPKLGLLKGKKEKKEKTEAASASGTATTTETKAEVKKAAEPATFPEGQKGEKIKQKAVVKIQELESEKSKINIDIAKEKGELQKIKSKKKVKANNVRAKEIDIEILEKEKQKFDLEIEKAQASADGKVWTETDQTGIDNRKKAIKEEIKGLEKEQNKLTGVIQKRN
jgi:hypothetical protein